MRNTHKIKRQIVEITFLSGADEQDVQHRMSQLFHQRLLPEIEKACSTLSPANELHRIDRLDIDLGKVRMQYLEQDILKAFRQSITKQLRIALRERAEQQSALTISEAYPQRPTTPTGTPSSPLAILTAFAQTGLLPWWADSRDSDILDKSVAQLSAAPHLPRQLHWLLGQPVARRRLWQTLRQVSILYLLKLTAPAADQAFWQLAELWMEQVPLWADQSGSAPTEWQMQNWDTIFYVTSNATTATALFQQLYLSLPGTVAEDKLLWQERMEAFLAQHPKAAFAVDVGEAWRRLRNEKDNASKNHYTTGTSTAKDKPEAEHLDNTPGAQKQAREGITIYNAGLVLLAPFLTPFFEHLGWVAEKTFVKEQQHRRAPLLLQYLAAGHSEVREFQLPVNKLLAGLPLEAVINTQAPLEAEEQEAGEELLEAVLSHASNLGLKTVDGLRGSFLLREGLLRQQEKSWVLHVQGEAYDIVLDHLPWAYRIIKLPWMPEPIIVEW